LLEHDREKLLSFPKIADQHKFRRDVIRDFVRRIGFKPEDFSAIAGRGGLTKPVAGGVYAVNQKMLDDLASGRWGEHPCNLGALIATEFAREAGCPAFVADPPITDEMWPLARYSGHPDVPHVSIFHALSQKAAARRAAREMGSTYEKENFVVVHMGGGISVAAHRKGRVVDGNNALYGEGPFAPERTGGLPALEVAKLCLSGKVTLDGFKKMISRSGGLLAYLGTNDCREVVRRIDNGDKKAAEVYEAMAYEIAKEIGAMAAVLSGKVTAVALTGGAANSKLLVKLIKKYAGFVAPFKVYPKMEEMGALAGAALGALSGTLKVQKYV
jgi:butyrate kinase